MRHVVICGACFINHIYVDIFLTVTNADSICLNVITWGLFTVNIFINHCKPSSPLNFILL